MFEVYPKPGELTHPFQLTTAPSGEVIIPTHARLDKTGVFRCLTAWYRSSSTPMPFCSISAKICDGTKQVTNLEKSPRADLLAGNGIFEQFGRGRDVRQTLGGDEAKVVVRVPFKSLRLGFDDYQRSDMRLRLVLSRGTRLDVVARPQSCRISQCRG